MKSASWDIQDFSIFAARLTNHLVEVQNADNVSEKYFTAIV
jgi:hypothetical protein